MSKTLQNLQTALSMELSAMHQYRLHASVLDDRAPCLSESRSTKKSTWTEWNMIRVLTALMAFLFLADLAFAQRGGGFGHGADDRHNADHEVFQFLLTHHKQITRKVTERPDGVETLTESDHPKVAAKIKEHVEWMKYRIGNTNPIRMRDPLFAELFRNANKIKMEHVDTDKGVRVVETSDDPYVVKLIQSHAKVVSGFVDRGFAEAMKNHAVPGKGESTGRFINPAIDDFGAVVKLPTAVHQPKNNSRILVDLTKAGDPDKLFASIEKVARFVNIYAGAGAEPARVKIAVVFHGDATLSVLNADAYGERFGTKGNPNFECLHKLHEAGVELIVCGQSLMQKKANSEDVMVFVEVGVSGLTAMANLQADGYAYVPLK